MNDGFTIRLPKKPLGAGVVCGFWRFAELVPAYHTNASRMSFSYDVPEHVSTRREEGAWIVKGCPRWIVAGDTAHPHRHDVRPHVGELRHQGLGVDGGIDLTKVRLHPTDGFSHPPSPSAAVNMKVVGANTVSLRVMQTSKGTTELGSLTTMIPNRPGGNSQYWETALCDFGALLFLWRYSASMPVCPTRVHYLSGRERN
jgi:hypothetical protein